MGFFVSAPGPGAFPSYRESVALYQSLSESVLWAEGFVLSPFALFWKTNGR